MIKEKFKSFLARKMNLKSNAFYSCSPHLSPALVDCIKKLTEDQSLGDKAYYEFGLFKGHSLWFAQQIFSVYDQKEISYYGFDSFSGLPKVEGIDEGGGFNEGDYSVSQNEVLLNLEKNSADLNKIQLFKGFFSNEHFRNLEKSNQFKEPCLAVIDCDLYSSTVPVLDFLLPKIKSETYILFDDYNCFEKDDGKGQRLALTEAKQKFPNLKWEELNDFGWHGKTFKASL